MITWETLESSSGTMERAKVPGGWFVRTTVPAGNLHGSFTYPPQHGVLADFYTGFFGDEFGRDNIIVTASMVFYPDPEHRWDGVSLS